MKKIRNAHVLVTLTRKQLRAAGACSEGMRLFESLRAMQSRKHSVRARWDLLTQMWLCIAAPSFAGWLRDGGLTPWINLRSADLSGADLRSADLYGADLSGAYRYSSDPVLKWWVRQTDGTLRRAEAREAAR